ncbi:cellulase family glycosylhydrolase [Bacteroidota bacterium]
MKKPNYLIIFLLLFSTGVLITSCNTSTAEVKPESGTLLDMNEEIMRGTPMVLGKNFSGSVAFATNIEEWKRIKKNGFNTIRICWVDPYYKDRERDHWTVEEVIPWYDKCVKIATEMEMNLVINFHNVGSQQNFDTTYAFETEKEFWKAIAPRYKDNPLVYYEIANEPTFRMHDYLKPEFKKNYLEIYEQVRKDAPEREILFFSFNTIKKEIIEVANGYEQDLDWKHTTIAYHMYNDTSSASVQHLMKSHRVICTEWFYDHVGKARPDYTFIQQVDGYKENGQTLESIGSSWMDWRDWSDTTLNELLDTLINDARSKGYWWIEE